jgi:hypothetical protein
VSAVIDAKLVGKAVWFSGDDGRAVWASNEGADHLTVVARELVAVGVDGDRDSRKPALSSESDAHWRAHVSEAPNPSRSSAGNSWRQPAARRQRRDATRLTAVTPVLSVTM